MNYQRIIRILVAFLVFLGIVLIFNLFADFIGEKSPTGPVKIFSWLCGSIIAFKIFETMNKDDEEKSGE
ncbi:MAG: hypothetical protein HVN35_10445 [Methanobacteriaceae archaeon]|nr:hypothetical protein [Methanobacteriaceae archaeon]